MAGSENSMNMDTLAEFAALHVLRGASVLIRNSSFEEDGKLTAEGGDSSAGIGGEDHGVPDLIYIDGGTIRPQRHSGLRYIQTSLSFQRHSSRRYRV